jgi:branched-chain amino acid transport system substrate-binding protein
MKKRLLMSVMTAGLAGSPVSAYAESLKIAFIDALSGPTAQTTTPFLEGIRYGVKKINDAGGFNGEPVALEEYDNAGAAATTTDKLREAISAGARIIIQSSSSAIAAQISDYVKRYNIRNKGNELIFYNAGSEAHNLVAEKCNFWYFKLSSNPFIRDKALVPTMKEQGVLGGKVYSINQNYSYGQEYQAAQAADVASAGSKIVGAVLHDISKIQDFSPYVAQIKESGAETVLSGDWGSDIILLMRAIGASGLKVTIGNTSLDTTGTLSAVGHAAIGAYLVKLYTLEGGGDKGKAFNEDFKSVIGHYPYNEESTTVFAMGLLGDALRSAQRPDRNVNVRAIADALESASYDSPIGRWSMRKEDHQALFPLTVSVVSTDAAYKWDGTDMGFKLAKVVAPEQAAIPVAEDCKMERPEN